MRWAPRVTVAAVIESENQFLLVEETEGGQVVVNQPAGHLEEGETLIEAVIREVQEETAWQFIPEAIIGIYRWANPDKNITYLRVCFSGHVVNHDPKQKLDSEIIGTSWLSQQELARKTQRSPMVMQCIEDYKKGRRYPLTLYQDSFSHY